MRVGADSSAEVRNVRGAGVSGKPAASGGGKMRGRAFEIRRLHRTASLPRRSESCTRLSFKVTVTYNIAMTLPRGRPPKAEGALTPANRKRAQRARDLAALWAPGGMLDGLTLSALVEKIPTLIREQRSGTLSEVLVEIGRRGGVVVRARPGSSPPGQRVKA
jgi:hypothetical protein